MTENKNTTRPRQQVGGCSSASEHSALSPAVTALWCLRRRAEAHRCSSGTVKAVLSRTGNALRVNFVETKRFAATLIKGGHLSGFETSYPSTGLKREPDAH